MELGILRHKIHRTTNILFNRLRAKVRRILLSQKKITPILIFSITLDAICILQEFSTICSFIVDIRELQMIFRYFDWLVLTFIYCRHSIQFRFCFLLKSICCIFVIILNMNITHLTGLGWRKETIFVIYLKIHLSVIMVNNIIKSFGNYMSLW